MLLAIILESSGRTTTSHLALLMEVRESVRTCHIPGLNKGKKMELALEEKGAPGLPVSQVPMRLQLTP